METQPSLSRLVSAEVAPAWLDAPVCASVCVFVCEVGRLSGGSLNASQLFLRRWT